MSAEISSLDGDKLAALQYHDDNALHSRVNILLVAESLFLAALTQAWSERGIFALAIQLAVCFLGWLVTCQVRKTTRSLACATSYLAERRKAGEPTTYKLFIEHLQATERPQKQKGHTWRLANTVPTIFLWGWGILSVIVLLHYLSTICPALPKWVTGAG